MAEERTRVIYYGDNLEILRGHVPTESVGLAYLDPPFKSQQQYNLLFRTVRGEPAQAQVRAFSDTWKWGLEAKATYDRLMNDSLVPGRVSQMVGAFHQFLGPSEMLAYLVMMTPRLLELHRVLKPTGSLYLHCDPAASHYLKLVLDTVFGPGNFRNEVVWKRQYSHGSAKRYGPIHDTILMYSKTADYTWVGGHHTYTEDYVRRFFTKVDSNGRRYRLVTCSAPGPRPDTKAHYEWRGVWPPQDRHWAFTKERMEEFDRQGLLVHSKTGLPSYKEYLDAMPGTPLQDWWDDVLRIGAVATERLGYQTQKPLALLRRIIQASTNPGELVLDPFCGCGTALVAAEELGRSWMGIDVTYLAVDVMARRLRDAFPGITFEVRGQPQDVEGARALAGRDRFQFQVWALSLVEAQPLDPDRRGADRGIDGYLPFLIGPEQYQRAVVQVKSGHVGVKEVRDLRGTLEREKAPFALLITLQESTRDMRTEAADAGFYQVPGTGQQVPRLQIITIQELLRGERPRLPTTQVSPTPAAPRLRRAGGRQLSLSERSGPPSPGGREGEGGGMEAKGKKLRGGAYGHADEGRLHRTGEARPAYGPPRPSGGVSPDGV